MSAIRMQRKEVASYMPDGPASSADSASLNTCDGGPSASARSILVSALSHKLTSLIVGVVTPTTPLACPLLVDSRHELN